ncbi:hypothetical protein HK101_008069 [Irineochytrium annulatum]|nr:hypothetical protein HK101_008069 [Irineochytrium annulatum]
MSSNVYLVPDVGDMMDDIMILIRTRREGRRGRELPPDSKRFAFDLATKVHSSMAVLTAKWPSIKLPNPPTEIESTGLTPRSTPTKGQTTATRTGASASVMPSATKTGASASVTPSVPAPSVPTPSVPAAPSPAASGSKTVPATSSKPSLLSPMKRKTTASRRTVIVDLEEGYDDLEEGDDDQEEEEGAVVLPREEGTGDDEGGTEEVGEDDEEKEDAHEGQEESDNGRIPESVKSALKSTPNHKFNLVQLFEIGADHVRHNLPQITEVVDRFDVYWRNTMNAAFKVKAEDKKDEVVEHVKKFFTNGVGDKEIFGTGQDAIDGAIFVFSKAVNKLKAVRAKSARERKGKEAATGKVAVKGTGRRTRRRTSEVQ